MTENKRNYQRENDRKRQKEGKKLDKKMNKFSPEQKKIIVEIVTAEASKLLQDVATIVNNCYYEAMREFKISEKRANAILDRTEVLIQIENEKCEREGY